VTEAAGAPVPPDPASPPPTLPCALCGTVVELPAERCPSCGLWAAGRRPPVTRAVAFQATAAFVALYVVTLAVVVFAR